MAAKNLRSVPPSTARGGLWALGLACAALAGVACTGREPRPTRAPPAPPSFFSITGTVLKPDIRDNSGVLVYCAGTSYLAYSDERGSFTIANVPPGTYKVLAQDPAYAPATLAEVRLPEGSEVTTRTAWLPPFKLTTKAVAREQAERLFGSVMGQVVLRGQTSFEGVVVRVVGTEFRTATDSEGRFQFLRLDPGQYTLAFERPGYRDTRLAINVKAGEPTFIEPAVVLESLAAQAGGRVLKGTVTLLDARGEPVPDTAGTLVYLEGTTRMAVPAPDGRFEFKDLAPARYSVTAMAPGVVTRDRVEADLTQTEEATIALTLRSGEEVTSKPGTLVGRVVKDEPGDPLVGTLVGLVETGTTVMTDAEGGYAFNDVPPGTYTVVAQADGYLPGALEEVVVNEGGEAQAVDLTLEKKRDYPRVLLTQPANGDRNVMIRDPVPVIIRFTKKMNPDSLRAAFSIAPNCAFRLYTGRENPQSDYDRMYVELSAVGAPESSLHFNTDYTLTVNTAATDDEGLSLQEPYRFTFRTGRASVIATRPANNARDIFVDPVMFRLTFAINARLDPRTVRPEVVRVRPNANTVPQVVLINSPMTGWSEISVGAVWAPGTRYSVTLGSSLRTLDGSSISNLPYTLTFTTGVSRPLEYVPTPPGRRPLQRYP